MVSGMCLFVMSIVPSAPDTGSPIVVVYSATASSVRVYVMSSPFALFGRFVNSYVQLSSAVTVFSYVFEYVSPTVPVRVILIDVGRKPS